MKDITNIDTMLELQGDVVLATLGNQKLPLTIVHFADETGRQLQLVNRQQKTYEHWPLLQPLADRLESNNTPEARWRLNLDAYSI